MRSGMEEGLIGRAHQRTQGRGWRRRTGRRRCRRKSLVLTWVACNHASVFWVELNVWNTRCTLLCSCGKICSRLSALEGVPISLAHRPSQVDEAQCAVAQGDPGSEWLACGGVLHRIGRKPAISISTCTERQCCDQLAQLLCTSPQVVLSSPPVTMKQDGMMASSLGPGFSVYSLCAGPVRHLGGPTLQPQKSSRARRRFLAVQLEWSFHSCLLPSAL